MNWKETFRKEKVRRLLPIAFLIYGLVSVFTLQRDFNHITQLTIFVLLIGPAFITFAFLTRYLERLPEEARFAKYKGVAKQINLSATQTFSQYILIFCLPFYVVRENWLYFGVNILWLSTLLWDPIYEKLVHSALYRHILLCWSLISATSFLYPFILPEYLNYFYPALALVSALAFVPTRKEKRHVLALLFLFTLSLIPLLFVSPALRFPILSVWARKPHFAWDVQGKESADTSLAKTMTESFLKNQIEEGHTLCCVAPVVAPPKVSAYIRQEWTLGDRVIESTVLRTPIQGNVTQQAFHSYFCKRNFPLQGEDVWLRCRIRISDSLDIGGTAVEITP